MLKKIFSCILVLCLVVTSIVVFTNNNDKVFASTTLNCKLNISSDGKYFQQGPIGGTNPRWVMKGVFDNVIRFTPDSSHDGNWEYQSYSDNNWINRSAQMDAMKAAGINTIRLWHFTIGYGNPSHDGIGPEAAMDELTSFCELAKSKGLFILMEHWWPGYLKLGANDAYYNSGEWYDRMQTYIQHFSAAGLDNVIFGTGNEPDNSPDPAWNGNWVENTKRYIAGMRRLGYTGPILCDTPGQDSQTWGNDQYAAIQASDPNKNIGFQEHEYGWNQGNIIPVCTAVINGQPAYKQFPIFITEAGWDVNGGNLDDWAYKCINENLGGAIFFWWNAPAQGYGPPTVNADGINLSSYGVTWRDHFWKASGMPDGWYNAGSTPGNNIPSKIEAENYTSMFGIATENCSEGTLNAGWTDNGDWMNYSVNVGTGGTFSVDCRVASGSSGGSFQIKSGSTVLATVNIPATGGWQSWQTVNSGSFNLPAGNQTIQVYANTGGWNLNWMDFKK